jgi:hypothetical protein
MLLDWMDWTWGQIAWEVKWANRSFPYLSLLTLSRPRYLRTLVLDILPLRWQHQACLAMRPAARAHAREKSGRNASPPDRGRLQESDLKFCKSKH